MTILQELSSQIEKILNGEDDANIRLNGWDKIKSKTVYKFSVSIGFEDYKKAEVKEYRGEYGVTVKYINCLLEVGNGTNDGVTKDTYNGVNAILLQILVPDADEKLFITNEAGTPIQTTFGTSVMDAINAILSLPQTTYINDCLVSCGFSRCHEGFVSIREYAGFSLSLGVDITAIIIKNGVNSTDVVLKIEDEDGNDVEFRPQKFAFFRSLITDGNVRSDKSSAGVVPRGSTLTISFDLPARYTALDTYIERFIISGEIKTLKVTITFPIERNGNDFVYIAAKYNMYISEASNAGERNLGVATSVKLVEKL